MLALTHNLI